MAETIDTSRMSVEQMRALSAEKTEERAGRQKNDLQHSCMIPRKSRKGTPAFDASQIDSRHNRARNL